MEARLVRMEARLRSLLLCVINNYFKQKWWHNYDCLFDWVQILQSIFVYRIGIVVTTPGPRLRVGQRANFHCSSDLEPTSIYWYENSTIVSSFGGQMLMNPVSTNNENKLFKCVITSPYGSQERNVRVMTYGMLKLDIVQPLIFVCQNFRHEGACDENINRPNVYQRMCTVHLCGS